MENLKEYLKCCVLIVVFLNCTAISHLPSLDIRLFRCAKFHLPFWCMLGLI